MVQSYAEWCARETKRVEEQVPTPEESRKRLLELAALFEPRVNTLIRPGEILELPSGQADIMDYSVAEIGVALAMASIRVWLRPGVEGVYLDQVYKLLQQEISRAAGADLVVLDPDGSVRSVVPTVQ